MGIRDGLSKKEKMKKTRAANKKFIKTHKLESNENVKIGLLSEEESIGNIRQIKTGIVAIDVLTGGLIVGLPNVWYGGPGVGKSTHVMETFAHLQAEHDAACFYANQEKSFQREYAIAKGVDPDLLQVAEFETTEQGLDKLTQCASGEDPQDIAVIDTLQALSPEGELRKSTGGQKSVADNTMALIPRLYSQFLRMYTSKNTGLTLLLISQVRTAGIGGQGNPYEGMTGGKAIEHYAQLVVRMTKSTSKTNWPYTVSSMPENSYTVNYKIDKIKGFGRYNGLTLRGYFVNGTFDRRFNIIAIGKDLGIHDGKSFSYPNPEKPEEMIEVTYAGLNEMINGKRKRLPVEAVEYMETLLEPKFLELASLEPEPEPEDTDITLTEGS